MAETMTRHDAHRPSQIDPADYEYVGQEHLRIESLGDCLELESNRARIQAHMKRTGGRYSTHAHGGNCMVCGSVNAVYTVLFYHEKTNSYVRMGQDCALKCDMGDAEAFRTFRTSIQDALARGRGQAKARAILQEKGLLRCWEIWKDDSQVAREETTIRDIVGRLVLYGNITDPQERFLGRLLHSIDTRAERAAQRAAEHAAADPCPEGRVEIRGKVLTTKIQDGFRGPVEKMLVQDERGFKVWGTVPGSLAGIERGQRVGFMAAVEPSKDDAKFGFFKRPTRAVRLG